MRGFAGECRKDAVKVVGRKIGFACEGIQIERTSQVTIDIADDLLDALEIKATAARVIGDDWHGF